MMRSLFAGVSGLQTHQVRMDVIGHNIANVNTVGFKGSRATFKEALSQTMREASAGQGNRGGVSADQVGLGVTLGSIDVNHAEGGTESTSNALDLAIQGTGFFILSDGGRNYYTRAGMFDVDGSGNFVSKVNGMKLQGYDVDPFGKVIDTGGHTQSLSISSDRRTISPQPTNTVEYGGNLSAFTDATVITDPDEDSQIRRVAMVYDSLGGSHRLVTTFTKTDANEWVWSVTLEDDVNQVELGIGSAADRIISFKTDGTVDTGGIGQVTIPSSMLDPAEAADLEFAVDFHSIRQFSESNSVIVRSQDGFPSGTLDSLFIDPTGTIVGSYSNGLTRNLAQVAVARFENPPGLLKSSDTMFSESVNSGSAINGMAAGEGYGTIMSNALEMSNVDLGQEFTNMIITQRGFQANSRIITSSDEMLQELVNLKR